jgi:glyoxylase-like metal-dependent hydrolase (beta-lactamase superfamily II)
VSTELPAGVSVFERGWLSSNNVLLQGPQNALVDSGYATHASQTLALVESALSDSPLDLLINTHLHSDHCGGNAALQARYVSVRTEIPPGDAVAVANWNVDALSYRSTGQQCPRFRVDGSLVPGEVRQLGAQNWEIHAAPGHDPHSIVLFEPDSRTLVSADALWETGFGVVFPELIGEPSFDEVARTLDMIEALHPRTVIPGHGRVFNDVDTALATARRRLDGLAGNAVKHARHAFKVLVKFKLLEAQTLSIGEWCTWRDDTPLLGVICSRFFPEWKLADFADDILADLISTDAARRNSDGICNAEGGHLQTAKHK